MTPDSSYTSGEYIAHNPTWHTEDSEWKANHILTMFHRHNLNVGSIADVGCGAGKILRVLSEELGPSIEYHGYDISPQAIDLARKIDSKIEFHLSDFLKADAVYDLVLLIDVFEHVEDYMGFLRQLAPKASYFVFHVPLDLSAQTVFRGSPLLHAREGVGHLHHFTEGTALATLADTGYELIDYFYTSRAVELGGGGLKRKVAKLPRKLMAMISQPLASALLGGFSLLILAKGQRVAI